MTFWGVVEIFDEQTKPAQKCLKNMTEYVRPAYERAQDKFYAFADYMGKINAQMQLRRKLRRYYEKSPNRTEDESLKILASLKEHDQHNFQNLGEALASLYNHYALLHNIPKDIDCIDRAICYAAWKKIVHDLRKEFHQIAWQNPERKEPLSVDEFWNLQTLSHFLETLHQSPINERIFQKIMGDSIQSPILRAFFSAHNARILANDEQASLHIKNWLESGCLVDFMRDDVKIDVAPLPEIVCDMFTEETDKTTDNAVQEESSCHSCEDANPSPIVDSVHKEEDDGATAEDDAAQRTESDTLS